MNIGKYEMYWINKYGSRKDKTELKTYLSSQKRKKEASKKKSKRKKTKYRITNVPENSYLKNWINKTRQKLLSNETPSEKEFYSVLSTLNVPFEKQYPFVINSRVFFADAVFHKTHTVVEIDGDYHNNSDVKIKDIERTKMLNGVGYRVIRIKNADIQNIPVFMDKIHDRIPVNISAYEYL